MRRILARARQLVDARKEDGCTALHLATLNNHRDVAQILICEVRGGWQGRVRGRGAELSCAPACPSAGPL